VAIVVGGLVSLHPYILGKSGRAREVFIINKFIKKAKNVSKYEPFSNKIY
jgi:hypothetical protein